MNTMLIGNEICNYISEQAFKHKIFKRFDLHKLVYYDCRSKFKKIYSDFIICCIQKVATSYENDITIQHIFRDTGALAFGKNILRYNFEHKSISIWTINKRKQINFSCTDYQLNLLQNNKIGESKLFYKKGTFYLIPCYKLPHPKVSSPKDFLGADLGVNNIVTTSDRKKYDSKEIKRIRYKRQYQRNQLQAKQTKSAKRRLKKISGKEQRYTQQINHIISNELVELAKSTDRAIVLEDLTNIRSRTKTNAKGTAKQIHLNWPYKKIRAYIEYKAKRVGVKVIIISPRYTSQECSCCGHIDKLNRKGPNFKCLSCGVPCDSDINASYNIKYKGMIKFKAAHINQPYVGLVNSSTYELY